MRHESFKSTASSRGPQPARFTAHPRTAPEDSLMILLLLLPPASPGCCCCYCRLFIWLLLLPPPPLHLAAAAAAASSLGCCHRHGRASCHRRDRLVCCCLQETAWVQPICQRHQVCCAGPGHCCSSLHGKHIVALSVNRLRKCSILGAGAAPARQHLPCSGTIPGSLVLPPTAPQSRLLP